MTAALQAGPPAGPEPDWNRLRERCLAGDPAAWNAMEQALRSRILPLFSRLTGDREQAQDLFQAFLLRLCEEHGRRLALFDPERGVPLTAYLRVMAVRLHASWRRSLPSREPEGWVDLADWAQFLPADAPNPERRHRIERALEALRPADRLALVLVASGFRHEEVAATLGLTPGGAAARIHRARERFRTLLREAESAGDADLEPPSPGRAVGRTIHRSARGPGA